MKWFKHYENAHTNRLLQALLSERNGAELYGTYFLFLELLCGEFKKDTTEFILSAEQIKAALRMNYANKLHGFLTKLAAFSHQFDSNLFTISQIDKNFYKIETPIILELMGKGFKRRRQCGVSDAPKKEEKRKKKEEEERRKARPSPGLFDVVSRLFTEICVNKGQIKHSDFFASSKTMENLRILSGFPQFQTEKKWREYFNKVADSRFLTGRVKDRSFVATLTWLLVPENAEKVLQGTYDNNENKIDFEQDELIKSMTPQERKELGL